MRSFEVSEELQVATKTLHAGTRTPTAQSRSGASSNILDFVFGSCVKYEFLASASL